MPPRKALSPQFLNLSIEAFAIPETFPMLWNYLAIWYRKLEYFNPFLNQVILSGLCDIFVSNFFYLFWYNRIYFKKILWNSSCFLIFISLGNRLIASINIFYNCRDCDLNDNEYLRNTSLRKKKKEKKTRRKKYTMKLGLYVTKYGVSECSYHFIAPEENWKKWHF